MRNLTIRAKITLWFIVILTVLLGLSYVVFYFSSVAGDRTILQQNLQETVDNDMDEVRFFAAGEPVQRIRGSEYLEYQEGWLEFEDDFLELADGIGVGLFDAERNLIFGNDPISEESRQVALEDGQLHTVPSGPDVFYVYERKLQIEGAGELWLRGSVDRAQHQEERMSYFHVSLFLLPLLILLAAASGYLITKRSLQPIRQLIGAAESISAGRDLKQRIDTGDGENEVQQLTRSFNEMMQRLDRAFEAEKQFTSDVSHELRTPMAAILAQCELALEDPGIEGEARDALQVIQRQANRMNGLIEDMLTYTRIDRHHEAYPMERLDLSQLVIECCEDFRTLHEEHLFFETEAEKEIFIDGSDPLLHRLLWNLLENGVRYSEGDARIRVGLRCEEGSARLQVSDHGIGIASEHQEKIFDRFYQADPARTCEGTGLGLAMVREIAQMHGGTVSVSSAPAEGSTFTVILPLDFSAFAG
ncbi:MAG: HAMP domain-containing histidine kinase [Firmicutes bacterium]|nr:HAMP domain-containing histidine kinase [Bacillota bacterium]